MPVVKFNNADIRFPDNMSGDEISDVLGAMSEAAKAVGEVVGMLGSGAVAEPVAGLTGLMTGDTNAIRGMQERMTYTPRTQAGQDTWQTLPDCSTFRAIGGIRLYLHYKNKQGR